MQNENDIFAYKSLRITLHGPKGALGGYQFTPTGIKLNGVQVVGARETGWAAMTGAADKATVYAVGTVTLPQLAGRVKAMQDALTAAGITGI
jgi:hypothetical protein